MLWDFKIHRPQPAPILSPCVGICELGADDLCVGCLRSGLEISLWRDMGDAERRHVMDVVLPERERAREATTG